MEIRNYEAPAKNAGKRTAQPGFFGIRPPERAHRAAAFLAYDPSSSVCSAARSIAEGASSILTASLIYSFWGFCSTAVVALIPVSVVYKNPRRMPGFLYSEITDAHRWLLLRSVLRTTPNYCPPALLLPLNRVQLPILRPVPIFVRGTGNRSRSSLLCAAAQ